MITFMGHAYECERCGRERRCTIAGCRGDCAKLCLDCLHAKRAFVQGQPLP